MADVNSRDLRSKMVVVVAASDFGGGSGRVVFTGPSQEHVYLPSAIDAD
jgi:hypothetical protein